MTAAVAPVGLAATAVASSRRWSWRLPRQGLVGDTGETLAQRVGGGELAILLEGNADGRSVLVGDGERWGKHGGADHGRQAAIRVAQRPVHPAQVAERSITVLLSLAWQPFAAGPGTVREESLPAITSCAMA
jgi:hypothetical protein